MQKLTLKSLFRLITFFIAVSIISVGCTSITKIPEQTKLENQVKIIDTKPVDKTLTIATVDNPDMVIMQQLSTKFTEQTGIGLNFVVLPENKLRQKVYEDVFLGAGNMT